MSGQSTDRGSVARACVAAIAATHARATEPRSVDWPLILELYDQLLALNPSPVVALNRAVAVAKVRGPAEALAAIEPIEDDPKLRHYHLLLAVRGQLLADVGRMDEAADCLRNALDCACSEPERRLLARRLEGVRARTRSAFSPTIPGRRRRDP